MMIHDITALAGRYKDRNRVGRGEGSGHGKQSGRGNKGAGSRSGTSAKKGFEGGQMRYFRRLRKFGFTNAPFKVQFWTVNIGDIIGHPAFSKGGDVTAQSLMKAGLVRDDSRDLKVLGSLPKGAAGVKVKLNVTAARVTASAAKMIQDAGGKVTQTGTRRDRTRGVDLLNPDAAPKNLTKKLKRNTANQAKLAALPKGSQKGKESAKTEPAPKAAKAPKAEKPKAEPKGE